jgi:hypothetical protein
MADWSDAVQGIVGGILAPLVWVGWVVFSTRRK